MFTRTSLQTTSASRTRTFKYLTMFFLGASFVVLATQGFNITTNLGNTIQYIGRIILTSDGSSQGSTGIILDGANGNAFFSGNVGISGSISATTGFINNFSATTGSIGNLTATTGFINNFSATTGSIGNLSVTTGSIGYFSATTGSIGNLTATVGSINSLSSNSLSVLGNIGIGTSSFNERLVIDGGVVNNNIMVAGSEDTNQGLILFNPNNTVFFRNNYFSGTAQFDSDNSPFVFSNIGVVKLFIGTNGNVGIGTGTPSEKLEVNGNILTSRLGINTGIDSSYDLNIYGNMKLLRGGADQDGGFYTDNSFIESWIGKWKNETNSDTLKYGMIINAATSSSTVGLRVVMPTDSGKAATFLGRVGIGTATPTAALTVSGDIEVNGSGTFTSTVTAQAFLYSSDRRYKDNISLITNPLQKILGLNGYTFNWKDSGRADIGVIAQEVEQVFPQAVATNAEGYKSVEYGNLVAPLIEAVKALYYKYLDQESRIEKLEQEIVLLKNSID